MSLLQKLYGLTYEEALQSPEMGKPLAWHLNRLLEAAKASGVPEEHLKQVLLAFARVAVSPEHSAGIMAKFARREPWVFKCRPRNNDIVWDTLQEVFRKAYPPTDGLTKNR